MPGLLGELLDISSPCPSKKKAQKKGRWINKRGGGQSILKKKDIADLRLKTQEANQQQMEPAGQPQLAAAALASAQ